jgi:hypothetical protein
MLEEHGVAEQVRARSIRFPCNVLSIILFCFAGHALPGVGLALASARAGASM